MLLERLRHPLTGNEVLAQKAINAVAAEKTVIRIVPRLQSICNTDLVQGRGKIKGNAALHADGIRSYNGGSPGAA